MQDDLLRRLRQKVVRTDNNGQSYAASRNIDGDEAADEIERLIAELAAAKAEGERLFRAGEKLIERAQKADQEARVWFEQAQKDRAELAAEREMTADLGKQIDRLADEVDWVEDEVVAQEKALEEVDALRAQLDEAREALEPFAKWCDEMELECPTLRDDARVASDITMADVRRARAVYDKIKESE